MSGEPELLILVVFAFIAVVLVLSLRTSVPYPILLVFGGAVLGLLPGIPEIEIAPEVVLLGVLPPLLFYAGYLSSVRELRLSARPLTMLAVGLVTLTAACVGSLSHWLLGLDWAVALTLGAIVSPTDPVAAAAIGRRLGVSRQTLGLLEGESLINDATALVLYRVAVAATVSGTFSAGDAILEFVLGAVAGVLIGASVGWVLELGFARVVDGPLMITLNLIGAYLSYLPADLLGASGVLAVVTTGVWLGWRSAPHTSPVVRMTGSAFFSTLEFLLNALIFAFVGLQLPVVLRGLSAERSISELVGAACLVTSVVIGVRFVWMFTVPYFMGMFEHRAEQRARRTSWRSRIVLGWSGMRGAVSLAAALAIPQTVASGDPFPERDLVLFLVYSVIVFTLVVQGLTLPVIIRRLGVHDDEPAMAASEARVRVRAAETALARIEALEPEDWVREDTAERVRGVYEYRRRRWAARIDGNSHDAAGFEARTGDFKRLSLDLLEVQRREVLAMRNRGEVNEDVLRRIERELDMEAVRLQDS